MILPAKVETAYSKDENGLIIEYVKLTNYAASVKNSEIVLNKNAIMFIGDPIPDMLVMYQTFSEAMKTDPESVRTSTAGEGVSNPQAGLMMLNELFNNEDFVNFVNDMIDSFEGSEVILDEELEEIEESEQQEPTVEDLLVEESPKPPKPVKRRTMNPETKKLPFNPESSPNSAESWSDNPEDYI
jgi:hypothetical protein